MRIVLILLTIIVALGADCLDGYVICTANIVPGVVIQVMDADTGDAVIDATVTLTEGDYTETLEGYEGSYTGAWERYGTYTLTVTAYGYETLTITDLVVTADMCHVITVYRDIELTPIQ